MPDMKDATIIVEEVPVKIPSSPVCFFYGRYKRRGTRIQQQRNYFVTRSSFLRAYRFLLKAQEKHQVQVSLGEYPRVLGIVVDFGLPGERFQLDD